MNPQLFPRWPVTTVAALGIALHVWILMFETSTSEDAGALAFTLGLLAWSWFPYLLCPMVAYVAKRGAAPALAAGGAIAALGPDLFTFHAVFVAPTSSTAAIALLFTPLINLLVMLPLGMLAAYLLLRVRAVPLRH